MKKLIISIGILLLIFSIFVDTQVASSIIKYRTSIATDVMKGISFLGSGIILFLITTILFLKNSEKRKYIPVLWIILGISIGFSLLLKYIIARPRPNFLPLEIETTNSFPSTHAAGIFAPLILIEKCYPKLKWIWIAFALLVLISRIYLGVHYLSDVIAGALLGYLTSILILEVSRTK